MVVEMKARRPVLDTNASLPLVLEAGVPGYLDNDIPPDESRMRENHADATFPS